MEASSTRDLILREAGTERVSAGHWLFELRWLALLTFPIGYLLTYRRLAETTESYLALTALAFFACLLLLWQLKPPVRPHLPLWFFLGIFLVAYYFQFYWMVSSPGITIATLVARYPWVVDSPETLLAGFGTTTYAFVSFAAATTLIRLVRAAFPRLIPWLWRSEDVPVGRELLFPLLLVSLLLTPITAFLVGKTGIALMGGQQVYLPYRLAGVIFWTRAAIIPALLLMLIYVSHRTGSRNHLVLGVSLLLLNGFLDIFLRASRAGLVTPLIQLGALYFLLGAVNRRVVVIGLVALFALIVLWPVFNYYRYARTLAELSFTDSLAFAFSVFSPGDTSTWSVITTGARSVFFRATGGMQLLLPTLASGISSEGIAALTESPAVFFTRIVLGYTHQEFSQFSPGLLGVLYLAGGDPWVIVGTFLVTVSAWALWLFFGVWRIASRPVALTLIFFVIYGVLSGGEFNAVPRDLFFFAACIGTIESLRLLTKV